MSVRSSGVLQPGRLPPTGPSSRQRITEDRAFDLPKRTGEPEHDPIRRALYKREKRCCHGASDAGRLLQEEAVSAKDIKVYYWDSATRGWATGAISNRRLTGHYTTACSDSMLLFLFLLTGGCGALSPPR
ncbi:hypothetical protein Trydic_g20509 [Trypoxylus dichotomus]